MRPGAVSKQSRFSRQYDQGAYLRGAILQKWNSLIHPGRFRPDATRLASINALADEMRAATSDQFKELVTAWRHQLTHDEVTMDEIVEPAFALLREVSRRTTGLFHYDEQILGGLTLVKGGISEMATGEGKTLAVSLPAFVYSLFGRGVHVITVNSYLAERDYEFSKPIFDYLDISIAYLPESSTGATVAQKKKAYDCDITYGVGYEFGFDYMRDQLTLMRHPHSGPGEQLRLAILGFEKRKPAICQRGHAYAIIDEVDSVLIDEAGSPLLISEQAAVQFDDTASLYLARDLALELHEDREFVLDLNRRVIKLTDEGKRAIFHRNKEVPWKNLRRPWETYVLNALKAEYLFERDVQYIVEDDRVVIVDEFTGRKFEDRSWREGQHQAVEAKEHVTINPENDSAASITRQRFFTLYDEICGLTGTASESAGEFWRFFKTPVVPIPLHLPCERTIFPERIFQSADQMREAIAVDVRERIKKDQPILVGTRTIRDSEALARVLEKQKIPHVVLTAKQHDEENEIIAGAGQPGNVVIATNMAGRGTHIDLAKKSRNAGGLHVICVERNESPRIDRQLVGRGARNGQPGSAQSFVSADDYILTTYAEEASESLKQMKADAIGELPGKLSEIFDQVQAKVEKYRYEQRIRMAERDHWLEQTKETLAT